jgi:cyclophilin family peptidyl-prolyl cis-trans isomerase
MRRIRYSLPFVFAALTLVSFGCSSGSKGVNMQWATPPAMTIDVNKQYTATIKTNYGDIVVNLLPKESPVTVNNFVFLSRQGFYDSIKFHRVVENFMIQTGDPKGDGTGSPGYEFADELPVKRSYEPGIVAMANAGANTNGSQFFICTGGISRNLNSLPNYNIFGVVTSGLDVAQNISRVPVKKRYANDSETSMPTVDVHIDTIIIEEK